MGIDVKTVRRVRKGAKKRKPRASKLDDYKPVIQELVVKKDLTAIRVLREIRALGYQGGYSVLKEYARSTRRRSRRRPHLRFETDKGRQGQVDLSEYTVVFRGQATEVVCFSMVFGYSRWQFIRFTKTANAHSVCHSHVLAFETAGGAPHDILYDRMKQVVLESYAGRVVFHPLFAALVNHYGFRAIPLAPGYKEGKGKVENPFKYVYSDFLKGSTFHDLEDLNRKAEAWLREIAWVRKHGTTQERPLDRMDEERPYLIPLPRRPFVAARVEDRFGGFDFCVAWDTNRYSVSPMFVGRSVKAMALDGTLDIYLDDRIIARHQLRQTRHKRYILPEHESEFRRHSTSRHVLQEQFLRLGEIAETFSQGLVKSHGGAARHRFLPRPKGGLFAWSTVRNYPHVILVEGLFDVAVLWQAGFVNTSCAFGVHLTDTQLSQLSDRLDRTVFVAFDSDLAGQNAARTLAQRLQSSTGVNVRIVDLPAGQDPNSYFVGGASTAECDSRLRNARCP